MEEETSIDGVRAGMGMKWGQLGASTLTRRSRLQEEGEVECGRGLGRYEDMTVRGV